MIGAIAEQGDVGDEPGNNEATPPVAGPPRDEYADQGGMFGDEYHSSRHLEYAERLRREGHPENKDGQGNGNVPLGAGPSTPEKEGL